jgi:hypothetical protein
MIKPQRPRAGFGLSSAMTADQMKTRPRPSVKSRKPDLAKGRKPECVRSRKPKPDKH